MQFCQPGYPYSTGSPSNTPWILNGNPEILGEGNLASVVSPNGSMHLVFVPTSQWTRPPYQTPQNTNNANWNPTAAWIIRSVASPVQPTFYQQPQTSFQPAQNNSHSQFSPVPCLPPPPPGPFELKFHNDICTSTSDILYIYPNLRTYETMCLANLRKCPSFRFGLPPSRDYVNEATSLRSWHLEPMDTVKTMSVSSTSSSDMSDDADCTCRKRHKKKNKTHYEYECKADINNRKKYDNICECKAMMSQIKSNEKTCECKEQVNKRKSNETTCVCKAAMSKIKSKENICECKAAMSKMIPFETICECKAAMNKTKCHETTCESKAAMMIKNKKNSSTSECKEEADKVVATFTDQASDCVGAKDGKTQTSLQNASNTQTCKIIPLEKATHCGSSCTIRRCTSSVIYCCGNCCTGN